MAIRDEFMWGDIVNIQGKVIAADLGAVVIEFSDGQSICLRGEDADKIELLKMHFLKKDGKVRILLPTPNGYHGQTYTYDGLSANTIQELNEKVIARRDEKNR